jgi:hypothetical protein
MMTIQSQMGTTSPTLLSLIRSLQARKPSMRNEIQLLLPQPTTNHKTGCRSENCSYPIYAHDQSCAYFKYYINTNETTLELDSHVDTCVIVGDGALIVQDFARLVVTVTSYYDPDVVVWNFDRSRC